MAKACSYQWRNSTFGEQLFRDTIIKICCSNSEAWFEVLVNTQYSFLSIKRCLFIFFMLILWTYFEEHLYLFLQASNLFFCLFGAYSIQNLPLACLHCACCHLFSLWSLWESIRRGQYIVHTSNKRPRQTAAGEPHIPWIVGSLEFGACGASSFIQKICIFLR